MMKRMNYNILADCRGMYEQDIFETVCEQRGITDVDHFLNPTEDDMLPLDSMINIDKAAKQVVFSSDYKIPSEDLDIYSNIIKKIPKNELIKLVHISQEFMKKKAKTKKQITALYAEKKKLGMNAFAGYRWSARGK